MITYIGQKLHCVSGIPTENFKGLRGLCGKEKKVLWPSSFLYIKVPTGLTLICLLSCGFGYVLSIIIISHCDLSVK